MPCLPPSIPPKDPGCDISPPKNCCVCVRVCTHIIHINLYEYVYVYVYVYMTTFSYIYVFINMCIYMYKCIYTYMYHLLYRDKERQTDTKTHSHRDEQTQTSKRLKHGSCHTHECVTSPNKQRQSHIHMNAKPHSYVRHDIFICETRRIWIWDTKNSYVRHDRLS